MTEYINFPGGIILVRNALTKGEHCDLFSKVGRWSLSKEMLQVNNGKALNALFSEQSWVYDFFKSTKFLKIFSRALEVAPWEVRVTRHSDFHINTLGGWHTDLDAGYCTREEASAGKIYKAGIFDIHGKENMAGAITQFRVRGRRVDLGEFRKTDLILFPVGIDHRGYPGSLVVRIARYLGARSTGDYSHQFSFIRSLMGEADRHAIFFTIGKNSDELSKFENANLLRAAKQDEAIRRVRV